MTIATLSSIQDAITALANFLMDHGRALPAEAQGYVTTFRGSPVDSIVAAVEGLYACAPALTGAAQTAAQTVCAQLADLCTANQWHDLGQSTRGGLISGAMRRELGEAGATDPSLDPEALQVPTPVIVGDPGPD